MTPSASISGSTEVTVTEQDTSSVTDWWPLALLLVVVLLLVLGVVALMRRSRRSGWDAELATQGAECRWVATTLTPALVDRTMPTSVVAGQWVEGRRRIDDAHLDLAHLASTAPTPGRESRATTLAGALDALSQALSADISLRTITVGDPSTDFGLITSFQAVERARQTTLSALGGDPTPS